MKEKIWLSSPHMGTEEFRFTKEAFDTNWIAPIGPSLNAFELEIADYLGGGVHVAALSSGTAAIHLALIDIGVGQDDIVLCSSFTFAASSNPIIYQKANPVFIDSELDSWNMDPALAEKAILESIANGKKPKAIILVHLYGMPANIDAFIKLELKYDIPVIHDSAEAFGSSYNGKQVASYGKYNILSFNGNKIITTSGGGALVSSDKNVIDRAKFLSTQAREPKPYYEHKEIGYNYRLSNVCAAIGRGQLMVLNDRVSQRRSNFAFYKESLDGLPGIRFLDEPNSSFSNRWLTCACFESFEVREKVRLALEADNVESRPLWKPMHTQPVFEGALREISGVSEDLFQVGLCLPSGSNLSKEDLNRVVEIIMRTVSN